MGIYNKPKKKVWQNLGEDSNKFGPLTGTTDPDFTPPAAGIVYVNTAAPSIWISSNTLDENCWRLIWD